MHKLRYFLVACIPLLASCTPQHLITGEPLVYGIAPDTGQVLDRDTPDMKNPKLVTPHKGEIITLVLNNAFIKYLKELGSPHVLVYAQIFDDGTDNIDSAITKVLYNERNSPAGVNLGLADRVLYGPTPFKGFPLRVKLFIVELDKEQKELASKIIDAAGTTAATAKPEAAPAIAVAVSLAKAINAMNEDDFELRFDMTLYPVSPIGKASTGDSALDSTKEPSQRYEIANPKNASMPRDVTMSLPLRTGLYAVMKRELEERFNNRFNKRMSRWMGWMSKLISTPVPEASTFDVDYSQEYFISQYQSIDGQKYYNANEILRYEGGYFYRIVTKLTDVASNKEVDTALVRLRTGPNRTVDFALNKFIRQRFTDRTHVVLSVVTGLPLGLEPEALKAASERDTRQLAKLLDNPSDVSLSERIGPEVESLADSLKSALEQRRIAAAASRRVGRDASFRTSTDYALFWIQQIDPLDPKSVGKDDSITHRNAVAKNAAILETLPDIVVNLPILKASDRTQMTTLHGLTTTDLQTTDKPGIFLLTDAAKIKLR